MLRFHSADEAYDFTHYEYRAGYTGKEEPIHHAQGFRAEDAATEFHCQNLAHQDDEHDEQEGLVGKEPLEEAVVGAGVMMKASLLRGLCSMTSSLGGSVAKAKAAKVSMMRFTHSICVTVSGRSTPMKGPSAAIPHAATFTVSWNTMNF